jgi:hypothetical protein
MVSEVKTMSLEQAKSLYLQVAEFGGANREMIGSHPIAESASLMPWMTEDEFRELQISIHQHGLIEKVELNASDEVCDGRNRLLACFAQDVDPEFKYSEMDNDTDLVDVRNLRRRHLEPGRRAMLYLKLNGHNLDLDSGDASDVPSAVMSDNSTDAPGVSSELAAVDTEPQVSKELASTESSSGTAEKKNKRERSSTPKAGKKKTVAQQAQEAGVATRTMGSARIVHESGIDELKQAALDGEISVSEAERIAGKPPEEQKEELENRSGEGSKRRKVSEADFDLKKTVESFGKRISKMLAGVPQSMRDTVHRRLAESFGATVRLEKETSDLMNSEGVVPYVEQLIAEMPKTERRGAEEALAVRYGNVVVAKDADTVLPKIAGLIEGLSEREKKKVATALGEQFKSATPTKPADYLPKLPDDHAAACEAVQKEIKVRVEQLTGFEDWEVNGRRDAGRALKKSALGQFRKFAQHAKLETEEQPSLIDVKYPEHLDNDDFKTAWTEWLGAKTRQKKAVSVQTQARQLNILAHFDTKQAVEILTKAMQKPWDGIPVYRELASTNWDGRPPAFPPADAAPATHGQSAPARPRIPNVPTRSSTPDRSHHGRLDTSRVPTVKESRASADE